MEDGKNNSNYKNKIEKIFAGFNDVNIIFIKSHEPDITVFTYILSHIKTKRVNFDVLLKVNSEKSFNYFNTPLTEIQRLEEPFDGLLKSKSQVEDILSILRNDSTALLISKRLSGENIDNNSFGWNVRSLPAEDNEKDDFFNSKILGLRATGNVLV